MWRNILRVMTSGFPGLRDCCHISVHLSCCLFISRKTYCRVIGRYQLQNGWADVLYPSVCYTAIIYSVFEVHNTVVIIRPHRMHGIKCGCCYRCSVCLCARHTGELIAMPFGVWTRVGSQPSAGRGTFRDTTLGHAPSACDRHAERYSDAASRYQYWATCYSPFFAFTTTTHTFNGLLYRWAGTRKVKPIWILLEQEAVTGSGISWAICKSAPCFRQITTPAPHHSVFYRPYALPATQPTQ